MLIFAGSNNSRKECSMAGSTPPAGGGGGYDAAAQASLAKLEELMIKNLEYNTKTSEIKLNDKTIDKAKYG
jgi:hypothetical protein